MRNTTRNGGIAAVLMAALASGGCITQDMLSIGAQRLGVTTADQSATLQKSRKVVHRVSSSRLPSAKSKPGVVVRRFCDRRHVEYQAGKLVEQPGELIANNDLCRQLYETGSIDFPTLAAKGARAQ